MAQARSDRLDFRQRLTNELITSMEEHDGLPWEQGWNNIAARPFNPGSGVKYRGGNVINLLLAQLERGSDDPRWMTFNQAKKAGLSVRKGAKAEYVEYWDWGLPTINIKKDPNADNDLEETEEEVVRRKRPRVFYAAVFNGEDIVGMPELQKDTALEWNPNELAEQLIAATGAEISHAVISKVGTSLIDNSAYYNHRKDEIVIPPRESFKTVSDYYATVLHELSHWTGHATRLNRRMPDEQRRFGSEAYAREELRAEIGAFYLTSMLGVEGTVQNHAKYTQHWLKVLENDKHEIFRAARDAEAIVEHIFSYAPELREVIEQSLEQNLLPKEGVKRALDSGIDSEIPNFMPEGTPDLEVVSKESQPVQDGVKQVGMKDPRWAEFEEVLRAAAQKANLNLDENGFKRVFASIEPDFTKAMDRMEERSFDSEVIYNMIVSRIIEDLRDIDENDAKWDMFVSEFRASGIELSDKDMDFTLSTLHTMYQNVFMDSAAKGLSIKETDIERNKMLYGADQDVLDRVLAGENYVIDLEFAKAVFQTIDGIRQERIASLEQEDDDVLTPIGMDDVMPDDFGLIDNEPISNTL